MPDLLSQDIAGTEPDPFTLNTAQNQQLAQVVSARQTEESVQAVQDKVAAQTVQAQATPSERLAPPTTPVDAEVTQAATNITSSFNRFIAAGGDIAKLSKDDLDAVVSGATILPAIEHPETDSARMYALYRKGEYRNQTIGPGLIGDFIMGGLGLIGTGATALWQGLTNTPLTGVDRWIDNNTKQNTAAIMAARSQWDNYTSLLPGGFKDIVAATGIKMEQDATADPDKYAQLQVKQSEIVRNRLLRENAAQKGMTDVRDGIAGIYKSIGADNAAKAVASVDPNSPTVQALTMVTDPANLLSFGAEGLASKVFTGTMRAGVRAQRLTEAGIAVSELEDRMAAAALARTQMEGVLGSRVELTDTAQAGLQSNLARLNAVQRNLEASHAAAITEHSSALAEVNDQMTRMAKADPARGIAGALLQAGGKATGVAEKIVGAYDSIPEVLAKKILPGASEEATTKVAELIRQYGTGGLTAAIGHAVAGPIGAAIGAGGGFLVSKLLDAISSAGADGLGKAARNLSTLGEQLSMGQQTLPYLRAVAEKTTGLTSAIASKLDNATLAPLIYAAPPIAGHAAMGAALGGATGYIQSGGDPRAAAQAAGGAGLFGAAGAGLGQLGKFNSPANLRQAAIGDRGRFIKSISSADAKLFNMLHPEHQLAVSVYAMAHPDLDIHFINDKNQSNGWWTATNPRASAFINVAGDNPIHAILAHEIAHHIAAHELGDTVANYVLGDPLTMRPGLTTALGPDGKPMFDVHPVTGKVTFVQNSMFEKVKGDYNARKLRDNPKAVAEDDYGIAQEIFADLHAHYYANPEDLQRTIRGHVPSDIVGENVINGFLQKAGLGTDAITGNPIPTANLDNAKGLKDIFNNYYKQRLHKRGSIEDSRGDPKLPVGDVVKGTEEFDRVQKNLDATGDVVRNPDGTIKTGVDGRPIVKSPKQADADHKELGKAVLDVYRRQPNLEGAPGDNLLKTVTDRDGRKFLRGQVVPDEVFNEISASNRFNSNQILNWRKMNEIMARNDGTMTNGVYNTASKGKGRYATVPARERSLVPIWTEISLDTNNVNIKAYDPEQMSTNINKMLKTKRGKELWDSVAPAHDDVLHYLTNLANGQSGETGIGLQKKGIINELFGFNADANPTAASLEKRSPAVLKSMRVDRMNRVVELPGATTPFHEQTYEQVRSFMQPREGETKHNHELPKPQTIAEAHALPSGSHFIDPNGKRRRKP